MSLAQEDIDQIQQLIDKAIFMQPQNAQTNVRYELDLRERTVRVEEELKHQRDLMIQGFEQMEKRFEQIDKRFEQVEKRFEQVDKRFEQIDKRFEQMHTDMNQRFEQIEKHLGILTNRMDRFMFWSLGLTVSAVIAVVKLVG